MPEPWPDIGNGYFIHPADLVARQATARAPPHGLDVLVFGSDGGGALYAVPAAKPAPVYLLRECSIKDGIALARDIQIIAVDYRTFLQRLEIAVETFAATGHLADLQNRQQLRSLQQLKPVARTYFAEITSLRLPSELALWENWVN